jgi:hypothetical protein
MKVLAIGSLVKPLSDERRAVILAKEVPHTLQLYLKGAIEQFWFRQDKPGPVFLMDVETIEEAKAIIDAMPLMVDGVAAYEYMQLGPLKPLGMLIQA